LLEEELACVEGPLFSACSVIVDVYKSLVFGVTDKVEELAGDNITEFVDVALYQCLGLKRVEGFDVKALIEGVGSLLSVNYAVGSEAFEGYVGGIKLY